MKDAPACAAGRFSGAGATYCGLCPSGQTSGEGSSGRVPVDAGSRAAGDGEGAHDDSTASSTMGDVDVSALAAERELALLRRFGQPVVEEQLPGTRAVRCVLDDRGVGVLSTHLSFFEEASGTAAIREVLDDPALHGSFDSLVKMQTTRRETNRVYAGWRDVEAALDGEQGRRGPGGGDDAPDAVGARAADADPRAGETWRFKCHCGVDCQDFDDGEAMWQCEQCESWQHARCAMPSCMHRICPDPYFCRECAPIVAQKRPAPPAGPPPEPEKSPYEKERDARIARNADFLASLGLGGGLAPTEEKKKKTVKKRKAEPPPEAAPRKQRILQGPLVRYVATFERYLLASAAGPDTIDDDDDDAERDAAAAPPPPVVHPHGPPTLRKVYLARRAPAPKKPKAALTDADLAAAKALVAAWNAEEDAWKVVKAVLAEVVGKTKLQAALDEANAAHSRARVSLAALRKAASTRVKAAANKLKKESVPA
ncbi:exodeoxyribonuclease III [Aureococcus anophagefferens]|nr:exodeoxyribonuclease III [Aureococcus anophagefferens]